MIEHADTIITVGLWLSVAAWVGVLALVWRVWRRESLPEVAYGGVSLSPGRVRWLWTAWILGATLLGSANDPVVLNSVDTNDPDARAAASPMAQSRTTSTTVPLPFYRYERVSETVDGVPVSSHELRGFVIPTPLLWTLLAYFFLVVRFNPDSRWTRRILHGKKRRWLPDDEAA